MSIDEPETEAHAELMAKISFLSNALTTVLQTHAAGIPMATVIGVLECVKLDAHLSVYGRFGAAQGELQ